MSPFFVTKPKLGLYCLIMSGSILRWMARCCLSKSLPQYKATWIRNSLIQATGWIKEKIFHVCNYFQVFLIELPLISSRTTSNTIFLLKIWPLLLIGTLSSKYALNLQNSLTSNFRHPLTNMCTGNFQSSSLVTVYSTFCHYVRDSAVALREIIAGLTYSCLMTIAGS